MKGAILFYVALQGVARRPLRGALTAFSLVVAVCAIVLVNSSGTAVRDAVELDSLLRGGDHSTISVGIAPGLSSLGRLQAWQHIATRTLKNRWDVLSVQQSPSGVTVELGKLLVADVTVTDANLHAIKPFPVLEGRWFSDARSIVPELIINEPAANRIGVPVAFASLRWSSSEQSMRARIVGVVYDARADPAVYLRLLDAPTWLAEVSTTTILLHSQGSSGDALRGAVLDVAARAGRTNDLEEVRRTDALSDVAREVRVATHVFVVVASIGLCVAMLSILNIGLATSAERSREFLLRLAFGGAPWEASAILIIEAQILAICASGVAIAIAFGIQPIVLDLVSDRYAVDPIPAFPLQAALAGVLASCGAALAGSVAPAIRAASVTISSATRE